MSAKTTLHNFIEKKTVHFLTCNFVSLPFQGANNAILPPRPEPATTSSGAQTASKLLDMASTEPILEEETDPLPTTRSRTASLDVNVAGNESDEDGKEERNCVASEKFTASGREIAQAEEKALDEEAQAVDDLKKMVKEMDEEAEDEIEDEKHPGGKMKSSPVAVPRPVNLHTNRRECIF